MKAIIIVAAAIALAACATPPDNRQVVNAKKYDRDRQDKDTYECRRDGIMAFPDSSLNQHTADNRLEMYFNCMQARGYEIRAAAK